MNSLKTYILLVIASLFVSQSAHSAWDSTKIQGMNWGSRIEAGNSTVLLAGGSGGIFRSTDRGQHWTNVRHTPDSIFVENINFLTGTGIVYAVEGYFNSKILRSSDAGASWNVCFLVPDSLTFSKFVFPSVTDVYAICPGAGVTMPGIFRSIDQGVTWTRINSIMQPYISACLLWAGNMNMITASNAFVRHPNGYEPMYERQDNVTCLTNAVVVGGDIMIGGQFWDGTAYRMGLSFSSDSCKTWQSFPLDTLSNGAIRSVAANGQTAYAVGGTWEGVWGNSKGRIFQSLNGGQDWTLEPVILEGQEFKDVCIMGNEVFAISSWGTVYKKSTVTAIVPTVTVPQEFVLKQNFPNPFNPSTSITFTLKKQDLVRLSIFDASGREVKVMVNGWRSAGEYTERFDGSMLASGVYFYKLEAGNFSATKKMMLVK